MQTQRAFRLVPLVLALMAVVSCATMISYEEAVDSLRGSRICCEAIAQLRYDQLDEGGGDRFNLDESSEAFKFHTGKSYFKAFRLPKQGLPYRIGIRSYALGEHIDKAHVFYPQVALLDERFAIIRQSTPRDFSLSRSGYKETASETWVLLIKIEGYPLVDDPSVKHILVFTTQELMSGASPYEVQKIAPVILPGVVTAIPTQKEKIYIGHSPFGLLHIEVARAEAKICQHGSEADIEPKSAITARFSGRDARLFIEAVEPGVDTTMFDSVVVLRGPDVFGGTVALALKDGCFVGRKFLSGLEYIHVTQMVSLLRTNPALLESDPLEIATLRAMAEAGNPTAQFHVGLMYAWGRGVSPDRRAAIEWLRRSTQHGFSPAMLALGMALSGPGVILDEAEIVGQPPRSDEFTDLVAAYFWLDSASRSSEHDVRVEASCQLRKIGRRMSAEELRKAKSLVRESKKASR